MEEISFIDLISALVLLIKVNLKTKVDMWATCLGMYSQVAGVKDREINRKVKEER